MGSQAPGTGKEGSGSAHKPAAGVTISYACVWDGGSRYMQQGPQSPAWWLSGKSTVNAQCLQADFPDAASVPCSLWLWPGLSWEFLSLNLHQLAALTLASIEEQMRPPHPAHVQPCYIGVTQKNVSELVCRENEPYIPSANESASPRKTRCRSHPVRSVRQE